MYKKEMIAMLLAGGQGSRLGVLTAKVAKPAVAFGGKYRIIDFPLSNCINSGIDTVGVLTQYQPLRLNTHIGIGIPWDLDRNVGGVSILPPYEKSSNSEWYTGTANAIYQNMNYMETYNASEGFFGIQNDPTDRSLLLMLDYGIFYEFIPFEEVESDNPTVLPLESVEVGKNYAMLISTPGGLWRYEIGDTVRFTSLRPYKFVISGRTKHYINAFGEELMVDNADKALARTCQQTGARVKDYTAAPLFLLDKAKGRHQWLIEFEVMPPSIPEFAALLDRELQALNSDYEAKRYKEISLQPLEVVVASKDSFYEWLKRKGKAGGQHKIPRLSNSRAIFEAIEEISNKLANNKD